MSNFAQLVETGVAIHKIRVIVESDDDKSSKELKAEIKAIIYEILEGDK
tara:strand:- start:424 stop:570 length:147 start_codon:yes stop_codon:yes gene_type:complete